MADTLTEPKPGPEKLSAYARSVLAAITGIWDLREHGDGYYLRRYNCVRNAFDYRKVRSATVRRLIKNEFLFYDDAEDAENPRLKTWCSRYEFER